MSFIKLLDEIISGVSLQEITEGLSPILFHFTYIENAVNILKQNKLNMRSTLGTPADKWKNRGRIYFMSTSRLTNNRFVRFNDTGVFIQLDGRKLSNNYKGFPVDYWGADPKENELEDRIVSNHPVIKNFSKYIQELHVSIDGSNSQDSKMVKELYFLAKRKGIPVYVYNNAKDWKQRNKRKAIKDLESLFFGGDVETVFDKAKRKESDYLSSVKLPNKKEYNRNRRRDSKYHNTMALFNKNDIESLSDDEKDVARSVSMLANGDFSGFSQREFMSSLQNDLHNDNTNGGATMFAEFLRKNGYNELKPFLIDLGKKWKDKLNEKEGIYVIRRADKQIFSKGEIDEKSQWRWIIENLVDDYEKMKTLYPTSLAGAIEASTDGLRYPKLRKVAEKVLRKHKLWINASSGRELLGHVVRQVKERYGIESR